MTRAAAAALIGLLAGCAALGMAPLLHVEMTNTGRIAIDVAYVSGGTRQSATVPACSRIVLSVPRTDQWSLIIDDRSFESSRDDAVREIQGTITLPVHFDGTSGGFDAPVPGAPDSLDPSFGTEC